MDGANGPISFAVGFEDKMGASLPSGLEDHGLLVIRIDAAVYQNARRVDDEDVQMEAALAAAQANHGLNEKGERLY